MNRRPNHSQGGDGQGQPREPRPPREGGGGGGNNRNRRRRRPQGERGEPGQAREGQGQPREQQGNRGGNNRGDRGGNTRGGHSQAGGHRQSQNRDRGPDREREEDLEPVKKGPVVLRKYAVVFYENHAQAKEDIQRLIELKSGVDQLNIVVKAEGSMDDPELVAHGRVYAGEAWHLIHKRRVEDGWYNEPRE